MQDYFSNGSIVFIGAVCERNRPSSKTKGGNPEKVSALFVMQSSSFLCLLLICLFSVSADEEEDDRRSNDHTENDPDCR